MGEGVRIGMSLAGINVGCFIKEAVSSGGPHLPPWFTLGAIAIVIVSGIAGIWVLVRGPGPVN